MTPLPRPGSTRQARAGFEYAMGTVARANALVAVWRWRHELAVAAGLAALWVKLGPTAAATLTAGLAAVLALTAGTARGRRFLVARWWCIVTPHRVRTGCVQAWIHSRHGKIPIVLLTRHQPFGERVYLWCRAGTSAEDFRSARTALAAACWAKDVQVRRNTRYAHVVALDVIRRERPVQWSGHPWFDIGTPSGPPEVPAPREPGDDAYVTGELPRQEPARWMNE
jgi:hypothetical protein